MINKQEEKSNSRKRGPLKLIEDITRHFSGIKPFKKYTKGALFSLFVIILLVISLKFQLISKVGNLFDSKKEEVENEKNIPQEDYDQSDFTDDKWKKHLGSFLRSDDDPHYFALASTTDKGLIKFYNPFKERKLIVFEFTPLSGETANIVIHVNDFYEIVIGDGDYETLTFKARESWKSPFKKIQNEEGELEKKFLTGIKKNTDVIMRMLSYCQMDGRYNTTLEIKFKPEGVAVEENQFLHSEYVFNPPFQNCRPFDVSVGLVNPNYRSDIEAQFISFLVEK